MASRTRMQFPGASPPREGDDVDPPTRPVVGPDVSPGGTVLLKKGGAAGSVKEADPTPPDPSVVDAAPGLGAVAPDVNLEATLTSPRPSPFAGGDLAALSEPLVSVERHRDKKADLAATMESPRQLLEPAPDGEAGDPGFSAREGVVDPGAATPPPPEAVPSKVERPSRPERHAEKRCPDCGRSISTDARFCPFDGGALGLTEAAKPADPLIGTVVQQRYSVEHVLGEGGMGTVYRVRHTSLGKRLALKALRRDLADDAELSARFTQEAKAAAAITHPNVVQITDFGSLPSGQPFFVMELLAGESLGDVLDREGALAVPRVVEVVRQIAEALGAAHDAGIIHRDLKPDNVFVGELGGHPVVKVLDFGLAKVAGASKLTRAGMVFGTPHYMAPEQAAGEAVDHRVDVYALGVLAYEMLTGKLPFEADTYMGVLTKHMYVAPVPPREIIGPTAQLGVLEEIVLRCLEKKPAARFDTMAALASALEGALDVDADGVVAVRASLADPPPSRSLLSPERARAESIRLPVDRGSPWTLGLAVAAAAVLFIAIGWWVVGSTLMTPALAPPTASAPAESAAPALAAPTTSASAPAPAPAATATAPVATARDPEPSPAPAPRPLPPQPGPRRTPSPAPAPRAPAPSPEPSPEPHRAPEPSPEPGPGPGPGAGELVDPWK